MIPKGLGKLLILTLLPAALYGAVTWKTYSYPGHHFSLESPFPLEETKVSKDPRDLFLNSHSLERACPGFKMLVTKTPNEKDRTLSVAVKSMLQWCVEVGSMSDLRTRSSDWGSAGLPASITTGTCKDKDKVLKRFKLLTVVGTQDWWNVILQYRPNDPGQEKIATRIVTSLRVEK